MSACSEWNSERGAEAIWKLSSTQLLRTASNSRFSLSVRMSPRRCSHSGFSSRLMASMSSERSVSVKAKWAFIWEALFPTPLPSSRTSRTQRWGAAGSKERIVPIGREAVGAIRAELTRVRERGFAIDDQENERNIRCVGSAVRDHTGTPTHAISVSALTVELSLDDAVALGPRVVDAARTVSEALGARPR
jgi:hypothetical protein